MCSVFSCSASGCGTFWVTSSFPQISNSTEDDFILTTSLTATQKSIKAKVHLLHDVLLRNSKNSIISLYIVSPGFIG